MASPALEADWILVSSDWWRTSFRAVPWAWPPRKPTSRSMTQEKEQTKEPLHPRPPHYHDLLYRTRRWIRLETPDARVQELELNGDLAGIRVAEEAVKQYEVDVCIRSLDIGDPLFKVDEKPALFTGELDEDKHAMEREKWDKQVRQLFGPDALERLAAASSASHTSTPTSPELDLTDSELSVESDPLPATPKVAKKSYAHAVHSDNDIEAPHDVLAPSPSKPLNAAALSFTPGAQPSASTSPPPSCVSSSSSPLNGASPLHMLPPCEFSFPTLNPPLSSSPAPRSNARSLPPTLRKDESGFYITSPPPPPTSSNSNPRPSSGRLPAFLTSAPRARHTSKTREMVDRLRKVPRARAKKSEPRRSATMPEDAPISEASKEADRNSVLLTEIDGWITSVTSTSPDDGWVAPPAPPVAPASRSSGRSHKRATSSMSSQVSQASGVVAPNPLMPGSHAPAVVPVYYPYVYAYPHYATPVYVPPAAPWAAPSMYGAGVQADGMHTDVYECRIRVVLSDCLTEDAVVTIRGTYSFMFGRICVPNLVVKQ
ncbi:hypothetical protein OBBRIDRAFT_801838 [Obba rivulosa]|uniref:Uncharacterized protein n=1 Tax=Obba rivulosa TaxID=1052685 RepID=A0A8E2J2U0_9APHY|nr:hypothetical protein OBBRIDRAFT_801838 [Obba rivulosa]